MGILANEAYPILVQSVAYIEYNKIKYCFFYAVVRTHTETQHPFVMIQYCGEPT